MRVTASAATTAGVDRVVNVASKTIIPGFVDMHAHHYREWRGMRPAPRFRAGDLPGVRRDDDDGRVDV
ncbi:MAG: hypothetical protein ACT4P7_19135 [Gemmatimonadaceae bacterium]